MEKFNPLNVSSKFAICGIPIRVDTYKTCSYNCQYCFSNHRKIMEFEKSLQIGDVNSVKRTLNRIFDKNIIKSDNLLENLIAERITWHCGGMSDPFQPAEKQYKITEQLIDVTNNYNISILFSTKSDTYYNANLNPNLHTFQLSVTNLEDRKDIEPNIPNIKERIKFFNELKSKGFKVGIRVQPFIPNVTKVNIIDTFRDADYFTIEGLKLIPQNKDQKDYLTNLLSLQLNDFTQMGLLNLKPETRIELYKEFINKLNEYKIPFSIADNDLHHISSGKCCCGDVLIQKSTDFNNTAMINKYGLDYTISDVYDCLGCIGDCKANHLFTSNRQEGCKTVKEFYEKRFNRKSSPFSPKFLFEN
jgi:DNA repair photolyase